MSFAYVDTSVLVAIAFGERADGRSGPRRRGGDSYGAWQTKFAASSVLPVPVYTACSG